MTRLILRSLLVAAAVTAASAQTARAQVDVNVNVSVGGFYDELAPYGQWVDCSYGQCWVPGQVAADWQPYSNGQWIYTEYGWTWVSQDPWGGSPYHYGTWTSIAGHGWAWVPGTVWAPAWVTWSYSNSYVGWAPLPPTIVFGSSGYVGGPVVLNQTQYVFVATNQFVGGNVSSMRIPAQRRAEIFRETKPVTGFAVSGGIVRNTALPMATIERASGGKIETRSIQTARTAPRAVPTGNTHLSIVAPAAEVKSAVASRPQAGPHAAEAAREDQRAPAPAGHETGKAKIPNPADVPSAQAHRPQEGASAPPREAKAARPRAPARPNDSAVEQKPNDATADHESAKAKAPEAPPREAHRQAQAKPPAAVRPTAAPRSSESSREPKPSKAAADRESANAKAPKGPEPPPMEAHRQVPEPPAAHAQEPPPRKAEASRPAKSAPKPTPANSKEPAEREKKPEGETH